MNKAFQIAQYSKEAWRDHCKLVTTEVPEPRAGEVIVNIYLRPGKLPIPPQCFAAAADNDSSARSQPHRLAAHHTGPRRALSQRPGL